MSVGGMGDLLSGIIGALLAFGLSPTDAAIIGVAVHGKSGEQEAVRGMIGMLPSDLLEHIRLLMNGVIS
jgi:NAD(P)H-hydrate epimerase